MFEFKNLKKMKFKNILFIFLGLFVGTALSAQTYVLDITGASPSPSTIAVGETSTISFNYQVPTSDPTANDPIPPNTVKIIIQFPAGFYNHNNVTPTGPNAGNFNWVAEADKYVGTNNVTLSNSILDPSSGGQIQLQCIGIAESGTPQDFTINVDEVSFLVPVSGTPGSGSILVSGTLPTQLTSFKGQQNACETIDLSWATAAEINNEMFILERKTNAKNDFVAIAEIAGAGNSSTEIRYSFSDDITKDMSESTVYYRLKQVDFNGKVDYSHVISVEIPCREEPVASVFPNPVVKDVNIQLPSLWEGDAVTIEFYNEQGKLVRVEQIDQVTDLNLKFNVGELPVGIYNLKLSNSASTLNKRFVRLD